MLNVYVPRPGTSAARTIDQGSGIVGTPLGEGMVRIDFEGNRYGASNLVTYADRVDHAADRHTWNGGKGYPTVARMTVQEDDLIRVGEWDPNEGRVVVDDPHPLCRWLDTDTVTREELLATRLAYTRRRELRNMLASGDPIQSKNAQLYMAQHNITLE